MNRTWFKGVTVTVAGFLVLLLLLVFGLSQVEHRSESELVASLKDAALRDALTCYAVEGRYPPDAAYLVSNYGLTYDSRRYIVTLHTFAENLLPDIDVLTEGGGMS